MEHLKKVLMDRCLPDNIKENIRFKRNMEEVLVPIRIPREPEEANNFIFDRFHL
jgi:hypothetical protein